jgi:hypothetical protein
MELWPASFQQVLNVDSFQIQFGDTTVRSTVDGGPAKVRSRYTRGVDLLQSTIYIDIDLYEDLQTFYRNTLNNGVKTFGFNHPMTGVPSEFRFAEPPTIIPLGGREFRVNMRWELIP